MRIRQPESITEDVTCNRRFTKDDRDGSNKCKWAGGESQESHLREVQYCKEEYSNDYRERHGFVDRSFNSCKQRGVSR
jgi:hypothetical protein